MPRVIYEATEVVIDGKTVAHCQSITESFCKSRMHVLVSYSYLQDGNLKTELRKFSNYRFIYETNTVEFDKNNYIKLRKRK